MTAVPDQGSVYVARFYEMDPAFEDMLRGDQLRDGMVVLAQEWILRGDPDRAATDPYEAARCRVASRWCTVTDLRHTPGAHDGGMLVTFLGVYADGTKYPRRYADSFYWIVKRDTIPGGAA